MQFTLVAALTVLGATLARADFHWDLYRDTECKDFIASFTGSADGPDDGSSYEWTGHLGSVNIVKSDDWSTQLNTNNDCIATSITCCNYAPDCKQGVSLNGCVVVDEDITGIGSSFTVCDSLCIDTGYKRDLARMFNA